ncbi:MAG: SDR family oxidoreductase [Thiothrix sp.]|uniref:SDR family oxidoreductase n=1 Tax=Thiothrix sp. TaxID=1032 RepID=UPI00262168FB|nr:SDR family oxidoreductase [Thiothrix sp.]MDD5392826.1 SDR family oxidoreductase [Thiothrix sp.]
MRNVLITGCSSGIGYCVAKGLRARGYQVFASARKQEDVERLESEGFKTLQLDLADPESVQDAVYELMLRTNSELYAVFHNGAYGQAGALEDLSREAMEKQFAANVFGWHQLTVMLMPILRQRNEGRIIYNSSLLGFVALPFRGAYNASKYAVEGMADTLRLELQDTDIKVCLIEPGPIESRFRANALQALKEQVKIDQSPHRQKYQGAIQRLEKVGPAVPFTLPPEAVLEKVIQALESPHPKARYRVTAPSHFLWVLKRLLPTLWLDKVLLKVSGKENQ